MRGDRRSKSMGAKRVLEGLNKRFVIHSPLLNVLLLRGN
jgi:hypothetical protein